MSYRDDVTQNLVMQHVNQHALYSLYLIFNVMLYSYILWGRPFALSSEREKPHSVMSDILESDSTIKDISEMMAAGTMTRVAFQCKTNFRFATRAGAPIEARLFPDEEVKLT